MAAKLSDEELREKLKEFDEDVGPITDTTRPYWRKKLDQHLTEEKNRHRKMQPNIAPLAQYSSDDSEADGNSVFKRDKSGRPLPRLKRRTSNRTFTEPTKNSVTRSQNNVDGDFKKPTGAPKSSMRNAKSQSLLVRPSLRSTTSNHSTGSSVTSNGTTVDFESSDSDIEEAPNRRSLRGNKRSSLQSTDVHNDSNTSYSIKSYGPRTSTPCRSEVVGRSELNSSTSTWEEGRRSATISHDEIQQKSEPLPAPSKPRRGRKSEAGSATLTTEQPATTSKKRKAQACTAKATTKRSKNLTVERQRPPNAEEMEMDTYQDKQVQTTSRHAEELHVQNLKFIQLQMELAQVEHVKKLAVLEEEHKYKMNQLAEMMEQYRKWFLLPNSQ